MEPRHALGDLEEEHVDLRLPRAERRELLVVLVPADSDGEAPGISELAPPRLRLFLNTYDSTGAAIFQPARSLFFREGVENTPARSCLWSFFSLRAHTSRFHQNVQHMFS